MFSIIGIVVVIGAVLGGYLMEHGKLIVLYQPAELVVIGGAALGAMLIGNPLPVTIAAFKGVLSVFGGERFTKKFYLENLKMLNEVFTYAKKNGLVKLEADVEEPAKSDLFKKYPAFLKDHHCRDFFCDTLRMCITGGVNSFDLDQIMELDMEVHHHEASAPVGALSAVADALPGLGIVAAVLGIIVTMGALGGPPEEIGHKVAAALVGTFLGVLMCYGFLGPMAAILTKKNEAYAQYLYFLRVGLIAYTKGSAPIVAAEFARRCIPSGVRPSFSEMEKTCKGASAAAAAAAASSDAAPAKATASSVA